MFGCSRLAPRARVGHALTGADPSDVPAAGATGVIETTWWLDEEAARPVPHQLRYGGDTSNAAYRLPA